MLKYFSAATVLVFFLMICLSFNNGGTAGKRVAPGKTTQQDSTIRNNKVANLYMANCSGCHGEHMNAFVDRQWKHGNTQKDLMKAIKHGYPEEGMPAFDAAFTDVEIQALADYILTGIKNVNRYTADEKPKSNIFKTEKMTIRLDTVVAGMDVPWGIAFLPGNELLVTDRNGKLYRAKSDKSKVEISGVPEVLSQGQGGLLDVVIDPGFASNKLIYLSYSKPKNEGGAILATTAIMKARLNGNALTDQQDIFVAKPYSRTRHHYGSRLAFDDKGYLYFSVGERGNEKQNPQEIKGNDLGKIHRIKTDGSPVADNPFLKTTGAQGTIYSYGHRNPQGLAFNPDTKELWSNEHGPRGGDELNIIRPGRNYGWPVITYGINYNGKIISNISAKAGMEQPQHYWLPSIAASGMAFVKGTKYPGWENNILSGALRFQYLNRSEVKNNKVTHEEILFKNIGRVRDVRLGPDGYIYMAVESPGTVYKLVPLSK
ncbi:MAG: PQQ-dependent sugar dehydrogenase [Arcticibacter sp.]